MPKLVRFVLVNSFTGIAIGWLIAAAAVHFNVANLGELLDHTQHKVAAIVMLALTFGITFGFAYLATAVMLMPTSKDDFDKL
ncbi:hypothetical protein [Oricola thermophila]|uniref:Uncharacterized protein n=1 Tax=Oricola thermophila TaxID=2742145 RepID=A0A6N1VHA5_9HYPH|nr:hypothetical protein [Oricola thermophila]QKV18377.1 hypothetical protein HTY61_07885 [Oricola thermophila]